MGVEYEIITAREDDRERIADFLRQNFYVQSPLNLGIGSSPNRPNSDMFALNFIKEGTSILAVAKDDQRIVGVCINGENRANDVSHVDYLEKLSNEQYMKIEKFALAMEEGADIWKIFGVDRAMYCHIISVDPSTRGQGIAKALLDRTLDKGRADGYPLLTILCTSHYSIKIARSMGMRDVYSMRYTDYKDENGVPVFKPPLPHTEAVMFALQL